MDEGKIMSVSDEHPLKALGDIALSPLGRFTLVSELQSTKALLMSVMPEGNSTDTRFVHPENAKRMLSTPTGTVTEVMVLLPLKVLESSRTG
jgi:hypothetical protein